MADDTRFGEKIDALAATMLERFDSMEVRSDELKSHLRVEIEALDSKVQLALEKLDHLIDRDTANTGDHARFDQRLENHDVRILALESRKGPPRAR